MLQKGAVEIVSDHGLGFYSRLFLVEKATGGWRPVIDLSPLNRFVRLTQFRMETVTSVLASIREGDFMSSIDLREGAILFSAAITAPMFQRGRFSDKTFQHQNFSVSQLSAGRICISLFTASTISLSLFFIFSQQQ